MSSPSSVAHQLALAFAKAARNKGEVSEKEAVKVSTAVSSVAFFYEKIRNVIDYKEDHLFCQSAIERNLHRQGFPASAKTDLAESIVKDLLRAGYLGKNTVPQSKILELEKILQKYHWLGEFLGKPLSCDPKIRNWLLKVASAEIETTLSPDIENEAMASVFYQLLLPNIKNIGSTQEENQILVYLGAKKTLLKSSLASLRYSLFLGFHPEWEGADREVVSRLAGNLPATIEKTDAYLHSTRLDRLQLFLRRFSAPFLILKDVLMASSDPESLLKDSELLEKTVRETCRERYQKIRSKLTRAATRSIVYIFLTKMVLALFLELPFDWFIAREIRALPLIINTLFPPFLMFSLVLSIPKPGEKNTRRILGDILEIVYRGTFKTPALTFGTEEQNRHTFRKKVFKVIYSLTFLLTFGLIVWLLTLLNFNVFSIAIFLFFITVVSFFAYRISQSAREIVIEEKETTLSAIVDFFMIPILRTGRHLSAQLSKINVFNFLLDFVIEAPLKNILEIAEDWLSFVREKKEEVV